MGYPVSSNWWHAGPRFDNLRFCLCMFCICMTQSLRISSSPAVFCRGLVVWWLQVLRPLTPIWWHKYLTKDLSDGHGSLIPISFPYQSPSSCQMVTFAWSPVSENAQDPLNDYCTTTRSLSRSEPVLTSSQVGRIEFALSLCLSSTFSLAYGHLLRGCLSMQLGNSGFSTG